MPSGSAASPYSCTGAMPGPDSWTTVRATRRNRAWATASPAGCASSTLTATSWRDIQSDARHTRPWLPGPDWLYQPEPAPEDRCLP